MYNGVLNINKPKGFTSHDIVARIRRIAGMKKVGHTGTLDPMAEGVLPICLGKGTRIAEYLTGEDKEYIAEVTFGAETDTLDAEGEVIAECSLPSMDEEEMNELILSFMGVSRQIPPIYSAIKKDGKPLYKYAREGKNPDIPSREINISMIELLFYDQNKLRFKVVCSKGTYIRSLARDLALKAGSCGHLTYLQRTRSGSFRIEDSVTLEELEQKGVESYLESISDSLPDFYTVSLDPEQSQKASLGNQVMLESFRDLSIDRVKILDPSGSIIAIGIIDSGVLKPKKVFV